MPAIEMAVLDAFAVEDGTEAVREGAHDLRNSMNALLLSAAALGMRADVLPPPLGDIARQAQQQGRLCAAKLAVLLERVDRLVKSRG